MLRKLAAGTAVSFALAASMILGVAAPANAASIPGAWNLWDFLLTIKSSQIMASQGPAAVAAWTSQTARTAALSANTFRSGLVYGTVAAEKIAEVIPLYDPIDLGYGLGRKIPVAPGASGPRVPAFNAKSFFKPSIAGGGALAIAITAYMMRGDIASGALGWVGIDAQGSVCESPEFGDSGSFTNFLTGQDCELWDMAQAQIDQINADVIAGAVGQKICQPAPNNTNCYTWKTTQRYGSVPGRLDYWGYAEGPSNGRIKFQKLDGTWYSVPGTGRGANTTLNGHTVNVQAVLVNVAGTGAPLAVFDLKGYCYVTTTGTFAPTLPCISPVGEVHDAEADPERWLECKITGTDGTVRTGLTDRFRESEHSYPQPNCPPVPSGVGVQHILVTEFKDGGGSTVIRDEESSDEYQEYQEEFGELCAANSCFLDLIYLPTGLSCFGMGDDCDGWLADPDRDTKYACNYGGVAQPVQECYAYANTFNTDKRIAGNPYADPKTGEDLGGSTGLRYDVDLMGRPVDNPAFARACGGQSDAINPIEWVLRPIQCALSWAFVPRPQIIQSAVELSQEKLSTKMPAQLAAVVGSWNFAIPSTGCSGFTLDFVLFPEPVQVMNACPGSPLADLAYWSRIAGNLAFSGYGVVAVSRNVGRMFGFGGLGAGS